MRNAFNVEDFSQDEAAAAVGGLFQVDFSDPEVEQIITVGDLYTLLLQKFPPNEDNRKCATVMAFYRLRRALSDKRPRKELLPSFDLTTLKGLSAKELFKDLEQATGLTLPRCGKTRIGSGANAVGCIGSVIFILGPIVALAMLFTTAPLAMGAREMRVLYAILLGIIAPLIGYRAVKLAKSIDRRDPGVIPDKYRTLGSLSRRAALMNYGSLAKSGAARNEKVIWSLFTELLSRELLHERVHVAASEIGYETRFYD